MVRRGTQIVTGGDRRRHNLREYKERQRYRNVYALTFTNKAINTFLDRNQWADEDSCPKYGIYNDGDEWVLVGFSVVRYVERPTTDRRGGTTRELKDQYLLRMDSYDRINFRDGIEISRADTKKALMQKISADGSKRIGTGEYVILPKHGARQQMKDIDRGVYGEFQKKAQRVFERN